MIPNFLIVGVARCGTTSLFHYLEQHPEIGMSRIKEPKYFSSLDLNLPQKGIGDDTVYSKVIRNESEYDNLFKHIDKESAIGEGSSDYFYYHEDVIPRIKSKLGNPKIIICLRNPIDRAYSAYSNLTRDSREKLTFQEGLKAESSRITGNWDWMWYYKTGSLYSEALNHFMQSFSNVKVILFDDLESHPKEVLSEVFSFLEVSSKVNIDVSTHYSHSGKPKSRLISVLTGRNNKLIFAFRELIIGFIPRKYLEKIAKIIFKKDVLDQEIKNELKDFFKNDINSLERLINRDLSFWK